MKIFISTSSFGEFDKSYLDICKAKGISVQLNPYKRKINPGELTALAKECAGLIAGVEQIDADTISKLPSLKVISRCGTGMDSIDLEAAKNKGIRVFNTPDAATLAVAELTIGLILNLLRNISRMDAKMKQGKHEKMMGNLLSEKKVGLIGFGKIGRKVAQLLKSFNCDIAYHDPFIQDKPDHKSLSKEELLKWADIVSLHLSSSNLILGEKELSLMKDGSLLINVSRGGTIDEDALYENLREGRLGGAALDVFKEEPYIGKLKELPNVILTPHIGSYAKEARIKMEREALENLLLGLREAGELK